MEYVLICNCIFLMVERERERERDRERQRGGGGKEVTRKQGCVRVGLNGPCVHAINRNVSY